MAGIRHPVMLAIAVLVAVLAGAGCITGPTPNVPITQVDPQHGYRPFDPAQNKEAGRIWLILSFSGGGTRAAAYAYGVLEALRDIEIVEQGETIRLLDEVDTISGVSGGSFTAAYYGLFGDRIFYEFEDRFLRKNVQRRLILRALYPWNLLRLFTPLYSRSDMAAGFYHKHVFFESTFADLSAARGPRIHINATDLPSGTTVRFNQNGFDNICSDTDPLPIAYAVAASSAVPLLLSPITLKNYAGQCGMQLPPWFEKALESRATNPRGWRAATSAKIMMDRDKKKYIHLVDGGISDNLGLRMLFDRISAMGGIVDYLAEFDTEPPDHIVLIIVNAENAPDPKIDLSAKAPGTAASLNLVSGAQIRRYNFDSILLARQSISDYATALTTPGHSVKGWTVEVSFDLLPDEEEISYYKRIPTSFKLGDEEVDNLVAVGPRILADSVEFQSFLAELERPVAP
jgi:NTE family protein